MERTMVYRCIVLLVPVLNIHGYPSSTRQTSDHACNVTEVFSRHFTMPPFAESDYEELKRVARHGLHHVTEAKHVVIVGAGISGIVAGFVLKQAGHRVTLLEANTRIGGRIYTYRDKTHGWRAELGARRIPEHHPLVNIYLRKFKLPMFRIINHDNNAFYYVNGIVEKIYYAERNPDTLKYRTEGSERGKTAEQLFQQAICPAESDLKNHGWDFIVNKYGNVSTIHLLRMANLSNEAIRMIAETFFATCCISQPLLLESLKQILDSNTKFHGIVGGNANLPQAFLPVLSDSILLDAAVTKIDQRGKDVVVTFKKSGRLDEEHVTGDYVIVTTAPPIISRIQYEPSLSPAKEKAIHNPNFIPAIKIQLYFSDRFWEADNITGGHSVTDRQSRRIYYPSTNDPSMANVVLASYTDGADATSWPDSDEECIQITLRTLSEIHKRDVTKFYINGVVKRWHTDKYTRGAYTNDYGPLEEENYNAFIQPEQRLFFAGEHASRTHGWIEGAIESALRASLSLTAQLPVGGKTP